MNCYYLLNESINFYQSLGYKYVDVPWAVDKDVSDMTKPLNRKDIEYNNKVLVASAEQSMLQLVKDNKIDFGKFITASPCFRDEEKYNELYLPYFLKSEIFINKFVDEYSLNTLIEQAENFFSQYVKINLLKTEEGYDIVDCKNNIELGSYGIRRNNTLGISWVYGTACATKRLLYVLNNN